MCMPVQKESLLDVESVLEKLGSLPYVKRVNRFGGQYKSSNLQVNNEWPPILHASSSSLRMSS